MESPRANRSALVALLVSGSVVAGCTGGRGAASRSPAQPVVEFDERGGDAFAWVKTVTGQSACDGALTLEANGAPVGSPTVSGSRFKARVPLEPGRNEIVAICDGDDGGERASQPLAFVQRLRPRPTARIRVSVGGSVVTLDGSASDPTAPGGTKIARYVWRRVPTYRGPRSLAGGAAFRRSTGRRVRLRAPRRDGEYYASLRVVDERGRSDTATTYFVVEDGRPRPVDMMREHPAWIDRAVIYAPIAQLWGNGGPTTVRRRLRYLKDLGVDALWLWPPATRRATGEEYAITNYFDLDPSWGPRRAFQRMVDEAHRLGLRVLLDFVPNHMSAESPYFKDAVEHGEASSYWDFFDRSPNGKPTHYFDWTHLPNLNYDNVETRNMIVEAFSYWVRDMGIDGFRVDAAWGIKRRRPSFWRPWRRELKRIDPDLLLIAEAPAVDPYYFSHGFDVGYDWTHDVGQWAWVSAFEFPEESGALLEPAITNNKRGYSPDGVIMRFLNNNDTGVRFVDQYGPEMTRVAATLQFTVPGVPAMFAGDEVGASYEPYSNLTPIVWRDRFKLRPLYKRLIDLRDRVPALHSRDIDMLDVEPNSALAYVRPEVDGGGPVLVVLNFGSRSRVRIAGSPALDAVLAPSRGAMTDLVTGRRIDLGDAAGALSMSMDAQSSFVLVSEGTR